MSSNFSDRDRVLLGYAPRDPFGPAPENSGTSSSSLDVDFSDVFGGPPRRSSVTDSVRRSWADPPDPGSRRGSGSGYGSGLGERPVFGEVNSPARRRHLKDDFFSDIFQCEESACSSPTRMERDSLNSPSPVSRILSPTRPLPPIRSEAVSGGSLLPARFSQSMKLARLMDQGMRSSSQCSTYKCDDGFPESIPSSPTTSVTSFTNRPVTAHDDMKTDGHVLYCQSPLSHQVSHSMEKSSEAMDSSSLGIKNHFQKDSASLENDVSRGHFHFSIYKWAGKGVTLVMPSKSNLQHESRFRRLPEIVVQEVDMILHEDDMLSIPNTTYKSQGNLAKSVNGITTETKVTADSTTLKGSFPSKLVSKFIHSDETETSDDIDICNSKNEGVSVTMNEALTHNLKNLEQLVDDDLEKQQNEEISGRKVRDTTVSPEEKIAGTRVKGLVKDFIKIFNQEDSQKRKGTFEAPGRRSRGKDEGTGNLEDQVFVFVDKMDEQVRTTSRSYNSRFSGTPFPINQNSETSEKVDSNISFDVHMTDDPLSERKDPLRPSSDSTPDILDGSVNIEDLHCDDLEGCLIETVSPDDKKDLKSISDQDQFKSIDAKVREWSKGKEGNIRSLLSTLQYVLWPESGWKPVPLVDIIEGASVKRAYQKALLRLHPDKLQQKGAAPHQKYIAEKVFDIMQEAWDHFNSSSQIY